jgi:hypothetical protein
MVKKQLRRKKGVLAAISMSAHEYIGNSLKEGALLHLQGETRGGFGFPANC